MLATMTSPRREFHKCRRDSISPKGTQGNEKPSETRAGISVARRISILGAGNSKAVSGIMPGAEELGREIPKQLEIPANLTRGTFENQLSRLGEDRPSVPPQDFLRRSYFRQI